MALPTERRHRGTSPSEHPSASLRRRRDLASTKPSIFLLSHCGNHSNHNRLLYTNDSSPASCFPLKSQLSCAALTHSPLLWGNKHSKDSWVPGSSKPRASRFYDDAAQRHPGHLPSAVLPAPAPLFLNIRTKKATCVTLIKQDED